MTRGGGGGGEEEIPSAKCQTSRRVCPRNILATQRAGPVSPKPQDSPRKTRAAPRTPLPVGPRAEVFKEFLVLEKEVTQA
ncbi:TCP11 isoform 23 [Pan troglodytes]|uniref:TCP11 isoform 23 n=1 Tax=Pan troglodytes TaxID=9598 RepID=A0A2J8NYZ1_PANTR|nr:TCP11 isoform 23 [Pan troglodytes]